MKCLSMSVLTAGVALVLWTMPTLADDSPIRDASSDAAAHFLNDVENANGLVLRVPINEKGEEDTSAAEMRIDLRSTSSDQPQRTNLDTLWENSKKIETATVLSPQAPVDSSTWGWYGWGRRGWARPYYYSSYYPSAYYYGSYYSYSPSYYQSYYGGSYGGGYGGYGGYYGSRYYYYGCGY